MKKFTKINYILTFILVFCIGATLLRHLTYRPRAGDF